MNSDKFKKTIAHLQSQIRNKLELAGDTTGVLTQATKDESKEDAEECELAVAALSEDAMSDKHLRKLLWLRHGCPISALYGDDGEMQCPVCKIDFLRDSPEKIRESFIQLGQNQFLGEQTGDTMSKKAVKVSVMFDGKEVLKGSYATASIDQTRNVIPQYGTQKGNWGQATHFKVEPKSEKTVITLADKLK
jgi:hypothetical protein